MAAACIIKQQALGPMSGEVGPMTFCVLSHCYSDEQKKCDVAGIIGNTSVFHRFRSVMLHFFCPNSKRPSGRRWSQLVHRPSAHWGTPPRVQLDVVCLLSDSMKHKNNICTIRNHSITLNYDAIYSTYFDDVIGRIKPSVNPFGHAATGAVQSVSDNDTHNTQS